jgi:ankyrin repeat protein
MAWYEFRVSSQVMTGFGIRCLMPHAQRTLQAVFKKYPNLEKRGVTPLVSAAASGHLVVVKELLKMGAIVNKVTPNPFPILPLINFCAISIQSPILDNGLRPTHRFGFRKMSVGVSKCFLSLSCRQM